MGREKGREMGNHWGINWSQFIYVHGTCVHGHVTMNPPNMHIYNVKINIHTHTQRISMHSADTELLSILRQGILSLLFQKVDHIINIISYKKSQQKE